MYTPSTEILKKYADVLIKFALNSGQGVNKNEVVLLAIPESAKPFLQPLQQSILESGAHYILWYSPADENRRTATDRNFFENAKGHQLDFFPEKYYRGTVDQIDHFVGIIAEADPHAFESIDSKKVMRKAQAMKPFLTWRLEKDYAGELTWVLALYGTPGMSSEAKLSEEEYWQQIIQACFLDEPNPIQKWQQVFNEIERVRAKLNKLPIKELHLVAEGTDLWLSMGEQRQWLGGSGRNIPSFELFTSPDCNFAEGVISFSEPLYTYGNLVEGIKLHFHQGRVVKAEASKGLKVLQEMIKLKNADRIGEFSLTDSRMSRITKYMANTLYDENIGGKYGNTHLALGSSYKDAFKGDLKKVPDNKWQELGFNDSAVHTDIMSTTDRTVTAVLQDGSSKIIYKSGKFTV